MFSNLLRRGNQKEKLAVKGRVIFVLIVDLLMYHGHSHGIATLLGDSDFGSGVKCRAEGRFPTRNLSAVFSIISLEFGILQSSKLIKS